MDQTLDTCLTALAMLADGDLNKWTDKHVSALQDAVAVFAAHKQDSERIEWMNENPDVVRRATGYLGSASCWTVRDAKGKAHDFYSLRLAIDAARWQLVTPNAS